MPCSAEGGAQRNDVAESASASEAVPYNLRSASNPDDGEDSEHDRAGEQGHGMDEALRRPRPLGISARYDEPNQACPDHAHTSDDDQRNELRDPGLNDGRGLAHFKTRVARGTIPSRPCI